MPELYAVDCVSRNCFHDSIRGYRLNFRVRRGRSCLVCKRAGQTLPDVKDPFGRVHTNRLQCTTCEDSQHRPLRWRRDWQQERRDMMFRNGELIVAQSQMSLLGCKRDIHPNTRHMIEEHDSLPFGFDARLLTLTEEPMPRCAVYFRWRPDAGQMLTPDLVFQCNFSEDASAEQRRTAPERRLSVEQFMEITQYCVKATGDLESEMVETYTSILCQHCNRPLPAKAFSTQSLRAVEKGD